MRDSFCISVTLVAIVFYAFESYANSLASSERFTSVFFCRILVSLSLPILISLKTFGREQPISFETCLTAKTAKKEHKVLKKSAVT